jgi:hypothetical protein
MVRLETATGFLVKLGGRAFVFTAKHNLDNETPRSTAIQIPRSLTIRVRFGEGILRFFRAEGDIDAAIVELDPRQSVFWQSAQPFGRHELGSLAEPRSTSVLCLSGFPVAEMRAQSGVPDMDRLHEFRATMLLVSEVPGHRSTHEPSEGRGIHVRYDGESYDYNLKAWRDVSPPKGISGGPLVAIQNGNVRVLGLARSIENETEWCEPVVECARLLLQHQDPAVAADALAVVPGD